MNACGQNVQKGPGNEAGPLDSRAVPLASLTPAQQRIVLALIAAERAAKESRPGRVRVPGAAGGPSS